MSGKQHRLWTFDFILTLGISFCAFVTCQSLNNGTPLYIVRIGGMTGFAGALILDFSLSAAVARLIAGRIIDNTGRKVIMIAGVVFMLAGTAPAMFVAGLYPQIVFRSLQGIGFACVTTASSTAAADVLPEERLGEGIGYYALGQSLGMAIGPAFGIYLCSLVFAESLFMGAAGVVAVLFILVMCCTYEKHIERLPETSEYRIMEERRARIARERHESLEEEQHEEEVHYRGLARFFEKRAFVGAVPMLIICASFAIPTSYTALYAAQCGFENAGLFFLVGAITMTLTRFFGGRLLDVVPARLLFLFTVCCGIIMFAMFAYAPSAGWLYAAGAFFGVSMGFSFPLLNSMAIKNTPPERWGAANAMFFLANDLGVGVGALVWGVVIDTFGFLPIMIGGACVMVASYLVALLVFPRDRARPFHAS